MTISWDFDVCKSEFEQGYFIDEPYIDGVLPINRAEKELECIEGEGITEFIIKYDEKDIVVQARVFFAHQDDFEVVIARQDIFAIHAAQSKITSMPKINTIAGIVNEESKIRQHVSKAQYLMMGKLLLSNLGVEALLHPHSGADLIFAFFKESEVGDINLDHSTIRKWMPKIREAIVNDKGTPSDIRDKLRR